MSSTTGAASRKGGRPSPYLCEYCGKKFVVPSLARFCEMKHLEEEDG